MTLIDVPEQVITDWRDRDAVYARGRKIDDLPLDEIVAARKSGVSAAELARRYNVSGETIGRRLRALHVETKHVSRLSDDDLRAACEQRLSTQAIARRFGVNAYTVIRHIRRLFPDAPPRKREVERVRRPRLSRIFQREYALVFAGHDHPRANNGGYVREHIVVAERAVGRYLPYGVEIHHVNRDPSDNRNCNLVVCPNNAYHQLLHARQRILDAGGNPNTDKICGCCKRVRPHGDFYRNRRSTVDGREYRCRDCYWAERGKPTPARKDAA